VCTDLRLLIIRLLRAAPLVSSGRRERWSG
jgi:hypothetical protein